MKEILTSEMLQSLYYGEIIERNPKSKPYSSFLVLGRLKSRDPLHIKCSKAPFGKRLRIVTIYEPSKQEWDKDYKTRKRKR